MSSRSTLVALFALALPGCFFAKTNATLPGLGSVPVTSVCSDTKSCDVRGDAYANALTGKGGRVPLASGQGPEEFLGRVAPDRRTKSALSTCSAPVAEKDVLSSSPVLHHVPITSEHKANLRAQLKAQLARLLAGQGPVPRRISLEDTVETIASSIEVKSISYSSQTYWLSDTAFERRVSDCGEANHGDIIYSMTVLELSELFRKDAEAKLVRALEQTFAGQTAESMAVESQGGELADASTSQAIDELGNALLTEPADKVTKGAWSKQLVERRMAYARLAQEAVAGLTGDTRIVAAFGFDEP